VILVDTSVWIDHLRRGDRDLTDLLLEQQVLTHPHVLGEIALGSLANRTEVLGHLRNLPEAPVASHDEVLAAIEVHRLAASGIGYTDAHLIAATMLAAHARLWTRDKSLLEVARRLGIAHGDG